MCTLKHKVDHVLTLAHVHPVHLQLLPFTVFDQVFEIQLTLALKAK